MTLTVRLLGSFQIEMEDRPLPHFGQRRLQALLAYLTLHQQSNCSRRLLAAALWPDTSDVQALKNLRTLLTRLRKVLPEPEQWITFGPQTLQWRRDSDFVLDVTLFQSATQQAAANAQGQPLDAITACEAALHAYSGDLLPDWYAEWVSPLRDRLRSQYLATLELLSNLLEGQQRHGEALACARRWVQADPLHEAAYAQLMRLHLAQGDKTEALRVFQACAAALRVELETSPGQMLQALQQQALASHWPAASQPKPDEESIAFVGRAEEMRRLQEIRRSSASGLAQLLLITGEAGIGKTRLATEFAALLGKQGSAVASARCFTGGDTFAYAPLSDLLRSGCFESRLRALDPIWASEVARLLPELLAGQAHIPAPGPLSEPWQLQRFLQAVTRVVLGTDAEQGTTRQPPAQVLLIDDLQWCDKETLHWIAYLLHVTARAPIIILATLRSEDMYNEHTLERMSLALERTGQVAELTLGPLSPSDTAALAANVSGHALSNTDARRLYQDTEGNPLFIVEFVRAWPGGAAPRSVAAPGKVQAVVRYRLAQLTPAAQQLVSAASVIGGQFRLPLLVQTSGRSEEEVIAALDELWQRQVVRHLGQAGYDFSHDQLRQIAYAGISPTKRRWLHGRAAEALIRLYTVDQERVAGQIAYHYAESNQIDKALPYYLAAAAAAAAIFANSEAIIFYQQAQPLLLPDDPRQADILEALGELQRRQGNWQDAQQAYLAALALVAEQEVLQRAALLNKLGRALIASHQRTQAWEALTSARTLLEAVSVERDRSWHILWANVLLGLMEWHYWGGSTVEMAHLEELLQPVIGLYGSRPQQVEWQQLLARMEFRRTRYRMTAEMVAERQAALELARQTGDPAELTVAQFGYAFTLLWHGQIEQAAAQLHEGLNAARRIGFILLETQFLAYLAVAARLSGQIDEARTYTLLSLESAQASQRLDYIAIASANVAWLAWRAGSLTAAKDEALGALDDWEEAATGIPFRWLALWPLIGAALQEQRLETALSYAARLLEETQQPPTPTIRTQLTNAFAAWESGYGAQARAHLEAAAALAAAIGHL